MAMYYLILHSRMVMLARKNGLKIVRKGLGKSWSQSRSPAQYERTIGDRGFLGKVGAPHDENLWGRA